MFAVLGQLRQRKDGDRGPDVVNRENKKIQFAPSETS